MEGTRQLFATVERFLRSLPTRRRYLDWLRGRRYLQAKLPTKQETPLVVAHSVRDSAVAAEIRLALEHDWLEAPPDCRMVYEDILAATPGVVVVQLRRDNICGCLGHRHMGVSERLFSEHFNNGGFDFRGQQVGEVDIAHQRIAAWEPWPLANMAFDSRFVAGSRLDDFRRRQFRLRLLSVVLHETNHLARPSEPESEVHARSTNFYREALASYFDSSFDTLSFTLDRSHSRLG